MKDHIPATIIFKIQVYGLVSLLLFTLIISSCQKIDYEKVDRPAYLRVFNSMWDRQTLESGGKAAYLCMLINPQFDAEGIPVGAQVTGDFLDKRDHYAQPYPTSIGVQASQNNKDWPGKASIPVGPIVNGFDLSSWAQIPSGTLRVAFMYRPRNETPFFSLDKSYRKDFLTDTTITLQAGEVYTMQALMLDFTTRKNGILLRQETFLKDAFSDDRVYVNFYNYSAKGFAQSPDYLKKPMTRRYLTLFEMGLKDSMNIYYSLYTGKSDYTVHYDAKRIEFPRSFNAAANRWIDAIPDADADNDRVYLATLSHDNFSGKARPYVSLPIWSDADTTGKIYTDQWQRFFFLSPGMDIKNLPSGFTEFSSLGNGIYNNPQGNFATITCLLYGLTPQMSMGDWDAGQSGGVGMPNMIVSVPSGKHAMRSFSSINTVEIINGDVYVMKLQRRFDPPSYN